MLFYYAFFDFKRITMTFSQVTLRLRAIKHEIRELRLLPIVEIQEKIQVLKDINTLLREQNQLLHIRQGYSNEGLRTEKKLFTSHLRGVRVA